jgi:hypothetical protein
MKAKPFWVHSEAEFKSFRVTSFIKFVFFICALVNWLLRARPPLCGVLGCLKTLPSAWSDTVISPDSYSIGP